MLPSDFPQANIVLTAAPNLPPSKSYDNIPAFFGVDGNIYVFITAWMPSKEDIDAIKSGRPIMVKVYTDHMPSISLFTQDDIGETNE